MKAFGVQGSPTLVEGQLMQERAQVNKDIKKLDPIFQVSPLATNFIH